MTMKLRLIHRCSFRRSEVTNLVEALKANKITLRGDDVVMLQSMTGDQLCFVWRGTTVAHKGGLRNVVRSERLRLDVGTWDPMLIVTYATRAGIRLDNLDLYRRAEKHLRRAA